MNASSRVPGMTRNSGWLAIDAEIAAGRVFDKQTVTAVTALEGKASNSARHG
jgi:hypothetical protein